jgi:hypothetical protein
MGLVELVTDAFTMGIVFSAAVIPVALVGAGLAAIMSWICNRG